MKVHKNQKHIPDAYVSYFPKQISKTVEEVLGCRVEIEKGELVVINVTRDDITGQVIECMHVTIAQHNCNSDRITSPYLNFLRPID
jgi:hypothetical protein